MKNLYGKKYYKRLEFGFKSETREDHKRILQLLEVKPIDRILEIGCGFGVLLKKIPSKEKIGIETNNFAIKECRKRGLFVIKADAEKTLPFKNLSFDIVVMNEVIEHLKKPEFVLNECYRVLKKNGKILITTPVYHFLTKNMEGKESHFSEMSVKEIRALIAKTGFEILIHEANGIFFLYPLLELFLFKPFRLLQKKKIAPKTIDKGHSLVDKTFLKPLSWYRKRFLSLGLGQLILAQKRI